MTIKILLVFLLYVTVISASGCCRGFKILQFRRPNILPIYETPPPSCEGVFDDPEPFCENSMCSGEPIAKYEAPFNRFYPSFMEPKPITQKCACSKSLAPQRLVPNIPRYFKRNCCNDPMIEDFALRSRTPCGQYGQFGECGPYTQCAQCNPCSQYSSCGLSALFRQPAHRILPLTLPASCIC